MKTLHALTEQIKGWRQRSQQGNPFAFSRETRPLGPTNPGLRGQGKDSTSQSVSLMRHNSKIPAPVMLALAVVALTSAIGYRFYNQPQLKEGTIAPKTATADRDEQIEDTQLTESRRKEAQAGVVAVLKADREIDRQLYDQFDSLSREVNLMRQLAGTVPFVSETVLSLPVQQFLRRSEDEQWQAIVAAVRGQPQLVPSKPAPIPVPEVQSAIAQLKRYQQQAGALPFKDLLDQIERARGQYQRAIREFNLVRDDGLSAADQQALLALSDDTWQETQQAMRLTLEQMLAQGIPPGLPKDIKTEALKIHLKSEISPDRLEVVMRVMVEFLEPNLVEDSNETKRRAEQAAREVEPVIYEVKKGEVIVRAGEPIARREFILLDMLGLSRRGINWQGLGWSAILVTGAVGVFLIVKRRLKARLRCRDRILLCLLCLSTPLLLRLNVKHANLAAVGLLASSFYSPTLAVTQMVLLSGLTIFSAIATEGGMVLGWEYLIPSAVGGLLAAFVAGRLRCREDLAFLGGVVGLTQGGVNLIVTLIISSTPGTIWAVALPGAVVCGLWGIAWCVVALGISPYLEKVFDLVTPIRLAELSNPNRPLLKRLATEAPGTFQHTLFVASLAEAAAQELHGNVELVRAGTLYHDIGKMHDPLGFIENQMGGPNKHDEINDPWKSAEIIKKHVSEGLVMARKYNLPQAIRDFIPEHQGTILISYFYFQAQQRAQDKGRTVTEADFRYEGPIPQSRETGIVMLADACEAALRSLKDVTPDVALTTVKKIFTARWRDNQLVESGLKKEELPIIANVFVRVWQQYNHQRIAYPKAVLEKPASVK
jgi:cyclic-di-AMP phosphodiesterase PgpH